MCDAPSVSPFSARVRGTICRPTLYTGAVKLASIAFIALVGFGCGEVKDSNGLADAPTAPDGGEPDAPGPGLLKVTVLQPSGSTGLPDPAARVIVMDTAGTTLHDAIVNAEGKTEVMVPAGGLTIHTIQVATDDATTLTAYLNTVTDAQPGDDITVGVKRRPGNLAGGGLTTMTATFNLFGGATGYTFWTSCGSSFTTTSPVTLTFRDSCHGASFDVYALATFPSDPAPAPAPRFLKLDGVTYAANGTFAIPAGFQATSSFAFNVRNTPPELDTLTYSRAAMIGDLATTKQLLAVAGNPGEGTLTGAVPYAPGVGTRAEVGLVFSRPDAAGAQRADIHTATNAASIDIDLAAQSVPWISAPVWTATGATWDTVAPGTTTDGMVAVWTGRWTAGAVETAVIWRVAQKGDATGLALPRFPAAYARFDPQAQAAGTTFTPITNPAVFAVDYDVVDGYAGFRAAPDTLVITTPDQVNAFVGLPWQRRMMTVGGGRGNPSLDSIYSRAR